MALVAPDERPWNQALSVCLAACRDHQEPSVPAGNAQAHDVLSPCGTGQADSGVGQNVVPLAVFH